MSALGQHLVIRLADNRVITSTPAGRRLVARSVLEQGSRDELLCFGLADTHLHLIALCAEAAARQLGRRLEITLSHRLGLEVPFSPVHLEPIRDARHLLNAFRYGLGQELHHGLAWDPLREGTNLLDLLGLRLCGTYTAATVRRHLPRVQRGDLLELLGVPDLQPASGSPVQIIEAALVATTLPDLSGASLPVLCARRAILAATTGDQRRAVAQLLGISRRTASRWSGLPSDRRLLQAIRLVVDLISRRARA
jgi:hypothetical protein